MATSKNSNISHIIVFMLENRSFDNVLGWLYGPGDVPINYIPPRGPSDPIFRGLNFENLGELANDATVNGASISVAPGHATRATNVPGYDPGEEYEHVNNQLFGSMKPPPSPTTPPTMKGFLADYAEKTARHSPDTETVRQIMGSYLPKDMPVLNTLAKNYAVSDEWFASVPSQTNTNRAFSLAGTSCGLVDNGCLTTEPTKAFLDNDKFQTNTVFNTLSDNGFADWGIFWFEAYPPVVGDGKPYTRNIFPTLENIPQIDSHFHKFDDPDDGFFARVKNGTLPRFTFIDPKWGGAIFRDEIFVMGNEMHPPSDITPGEHLVQQIYNAVYDPQFSKVTNALFAILYDEHGGTYDHVHPPAPAIPPWGTGGSPPPGVTPQYKFGFDRYGVRVPAILVHPAIEARTVFRSPTDQPFDHTSLPATVLTQFLPDMDKSKWNLGDRTLTAPTFESVVPNPGRDRTVNVFDSEQTVSPGVPINYGDPLTLLEPVTARYITFADPGVKYYYPQMGEVGVELAFQAGVGPLMSGGIVQIRTSEYLPPAVDKGPVSLFPGARNAIGAFPFLTSGTTNLYYWTPVDSDPSVLSYESWIVEKADGSSGPIHYGDDLFISSAASEFARQRMVVDGQYLTSKTGGTDRWRPISAISNQSSTIARVKAGDYVKVPIEGFIGVAVGAGTVSWKSLTSFLKDGYHALPGATWQGDRTIVNIQGGGDIMLFRLENEANFEIAKKAIQSIIIEEKSQANYLVRGMERFYGIQNVPDLPGAAWLAFDLRNRTEH